MKDKSESIILRFQLSTLRPIPPIYYVHEDAIHHGKKQTLPNSQIASYRDKETHLPLHNGSLQVEKDIDTEKKEQNVEMMGDTFSPKPLLAPFDLAKSNGQLPTTKSDVFTSGDTETEKSEPPTPSVSKHEENHYDGLSGRSENIKYGDNLRNYSDVNTADSANLNKTKNLLGLEEVTGAPHTIYDQHESSTDFPHASSVPNPSFLLGKRVRIITGKFYGMEGIVTDVGTRGWISIDNPALVGRKVQSRQCEIVSSIQNPDYKALSTILENKMKEERSKKTVGISAHNGSASTYLTSTKEILLHHKGGGPKNGEESEMVGSSELNKNMSSQDDESEKSDSRMLDSPDLRRVRPRRASQGNVCYNYDSDVNMSSLIMPQSTVTGLDWRKNSKVSESALVKRCKMSIGTSPSEQTRKSNTLSSFDGNAEKNSKQNSESNNRPLIIQPPLGTKWDTPCLNKRKQPNPSDDNSVYKPPQHSRYSLKKHISTPLLPPVCLDDEDGTVLPEALRHLPGDFKIEIFNRKTGRVLSGEDAVSVHCLPAVLRRHAEYEPIVPPPKLLEKFSLGTNKILSREGRSSSHLRVNPDIVPQSRVRASAAEKRYVVVTAGPYRGLVGRVEACMPGGWYLVAELMHDDHLDLDVVVHSENLDLVPITEESDYAKRVSDQSASNGQMKNMNSSTSKVKENQFHHLRIQALEDERENIKRIVSEYAERVHVPIMDHSLVKKSNEYCHVKQTVNHMLDVIESQSQSREQSILQKTINQPRHTQVEALQPERGGSQSIISKSDQSGDKNKGNFSLEVFRNYEAFKQIIGNEQRLRGDLDRIDRIIKYLKPN